jgi:dethiobiotin synthetase
VKVLSNGVFVVGTDTDIGKTVITAGLVHVLLKKGINTCSFKAVQSGGNWKDGEILDGDTLWVKKVCGLEEDHHLMNPYTLKASVSPHLAARIEGIAIDRNQILAAFNNLSSKYDFIVAEGAGGLIVPIIEHEYFLYDLIQDLGLPVIVVTRAGLGTINHTCLTLSYLEKLKIKVKGIIVNNFTGQAYEEDNIICIKNITGQKILAVINHLDELDKEPEFRKLKTEFEKKINVDHLLQV